MKLASFFILSLSLHASALVYPISFLVPVKFDLIDVTILPKEEESGEADGGIGKIPSKPENHEPHRPTPSLAVPRIEAKTLANPKPQIPPVEISEKVSERRSVTVSAITSVETEGISETPANNASASAGFEGTGNGAGFGSPGTGLGQGSGNGNGSGSFGSGNALTQARYRDTPKPVYPESARRDAQEGNVLLRVLVDDQGRSKKIEILNRSGSEALDNAAVEAIKRWRFYPARHDDKPVESWLRIPIGFRLADAPVK